MTDAQQPPKVMASDAALELLASLEKEHGPLMFHQSGGCCDGSAPMCYPRGEFKLGERDVHLGDLNGTPFYIGGDQYERWAHTQLLIDVVKGRGAGFSVEGPRGVRFVTRSRLMGSVEDFCAL